MNGKTVVITGASSGIGFGVAEAYVGQGANVVLNGRDEAKLTEAAERLGDPQRIAVVPGDIGLAEAQGRVVDQGIERFGPCKWQSKTCEEKDRRFQRPSVMAGNNTVSWEHY